MAARSMIVSGTGTVRRLATNTPADKRRESRGDVQNSRQQAGEYTPELWLG
jgi:hypothetical protein